MRKVLLVLVFGLMSANSTADDFSCAEIKNLGVETASTAATQFRAYTRAIRKDESDVVIDALYELHEEFRDTAAAWASIYTAFCKD